MVFCIFTIGYGNKLNVKGLGAERLSEPSDRHRKSLSNETTFQSTGNINELTEICSQLCRELADSLQGEQLKGRCLTLKTKTVMFQTKTKQFQLSGYTNSFEAIEAAAVKALRNYLESEDGRGCKLRLMGVRMSEWEPSDNGLSGRGQASIAKFLQNTGKTYTDCKMCFFYWTLVILNPVMQNTRHEHTHFNKVTLLKQVRLLELKLQIFGSAFIEGQPTWLFDPFKIFPP